MQPMKKPFYPQFTYSEKEEKGVRIRDFSKEKNELDTIKKSARLCRRQHETLAEIQVKNKKSDLHLHNHQLCA